MINLVKGQKIELGKSTKHAMVGLGWDTNRYNGGFDFDLDASVFLLNDKGKINRDEDFVFYNNLEHPSGSVKHMGDNRTGVGDGDDEQIYIDFSKIPSNIQKLAVVVTIHEAVERKQNFGMVENAYIRVTALKDANDTVGTDLLRFDLTEDYSTETALLIAEIYRHNGEWKFGAKGDGFKDGLAGFVRMYGGQC